MLSIFFCTSKFKHTFFQPSLKLLSVDVPQQVVWIFRHNFQRHLATKLIGAESWIELNPSQKIPSKSNFHPVNKPAHLFQTQRKIFRNAAVHFLLTHSTQNIPYPNSSILSTVCTSLVFEVVIGGQKVKEKIQKQCCGWFFTRLRAS